MRKKLIFIFLIFNFSILYSAPLIYQAEDGIITGACFINNTYPGYQGSGYVDGFHNTSSSCSVIVNVPEEGFYNIFMRYVSEFGLKVNSLYINSNFYSDISFTAADTFNIIYAGAVYLNSGSNELKLVSNWGWIYLDWFAIESVDLRMSYFDLIPATVSTEQKDVYTFLFRIHNITGGTILMKNVTFTVKDGNFNPQLATMALANFSIRDENTYFYNSSQIPASPYIYCFIPSGIQIGPYSEKNFYVVVDITGNTGNRMSEFKIDIDSPLSIYIEDYMNGNTLTVAAKDGFSFPMGSSVSVIQDKATQLSIIHTSTMPTTVSTDQENVKAMELQFSNIGNTLTASIKVSRISFIIQDAAGNSIPAISAIKKLKITNPDGSYIYGEAVATGANKLTVILSAPLIVPSTRPLNCAVMIDIGATLNAQSVRIKLDNTGDVYAVDANSAVPVIISTSTKFPKITEAAIIQEKVSNINLDNFVSLLPTGVVKGQKGVDLFYFRIYDTLPAQSAAAQFNAITITVKNAAGMQIAANSVFERLYITDNYGNTLGNMVAGVGDKVRIELNTPYNFTSGESQYFKISGDIQTTAYAPNFKAVLEGDSLISITDANSGYEADKIETPDFPWETGVAGVFTAPATDLWMWHNGNITPTMAGMGQPDVKFILLSLFNPGHIGTADIMINGITLTVVDNADNVIAPEKLFGSVYITNTYGDITYAYYESVSNTTDESLYLQFVKPLFVEALNTKTAYISGNINLYAYEGTYKVRINEEAHINRKSIPEGYVTVTAINGDNFAFYSNPITITALAYNFRVGHKSLMPVSIYKGQNCIDVLSLNFENYNAVPIEVTSVAFTIKDCEGRVISAGNVINKARILDKDNNIIKEINIDVDNKLIFNNFSFKIMQGSERIIKLQIDVLNNASIPFYIELEKSGDISTLPKASVNAAEGEYFGNMKSGCVSIQQPELTKSFHIFPNPVNPAKTPAYIEYYIENKSEVTIQIFTINGRLVKKITEKQQKEKGLHYEDIWDCKNQSNFTVKSGVYLCVLEVLDKITGENKKLTQKIVVLK